MKLLRKMIYIVPLVLLFCLTSCGKEDTTVDVVATPVEIAVVNKSDISTTNRINGSVVSQNEVAVYAPIAGEVTAVNVKVGDKVTKDQTLFSVDNASLSRNYQALLDDYDRTKGLYDKQIELSEQSLEDTKTIYNEQVRLAEQTYNNTKALYEVGAATKIDLEKAEEMLKFGLIDRVYGFSEEEEYGNQTLGGYISTASLATDGFSS